MNSLMHMRQVHFTDILHILHTYYSTYYRYIPYYKYIYIFFFLKMMDSRPFIYMYIDIDIMNFEYASAYIKFG